MVTKILVALTYVAMVTVNFLANGLPINNRSTGAISDAYPNLFAPAGLTFSIWGLIYLLLGGYVIYQFVPVGKYIASKNEALLQKINLMFIINALANIAWIFSWHYDYIGLSVLIMVIILTTLIKINDIVGAEKITTQERLIVSTPFSVYFGWITVATIANITVFLVSLGWNGFGVTDYVWTILVLLVGATIGVARMLKDRNVAYGLVLVWAYFGITIKHFSSDGFAGEYASIIGVSVFCIVIYLWLIAYILRGDKKNTK
jgi:hypothetical protein